MKNIYYVYSVGIRCQYEGDGWSELILDNENLVSNAKSVLIEAINKEIYYTTEGIIDAQIEYDVGHCDKEMYEIVTQEKEELKWKQLNLRDKVMDVSTVEDLESLSGEEVNGHEHIVIFKEAVLS